MTANCVRLAADRAGRNRTRRCQRLFRAGSLADVGRNIRIGGEGYGGRIGVPNAETPDFFIPESVSRDLLYNVIRLNQPYPGDAWRCPCAMARQMTLNSPEYRLTTDQLNVRANVGVNVGVNAPVVTVISIGQIVGVINGVECADDAHWWEIIVTDLRAADGTFVTGWVAEGIGGDYFFASVE